MPNAELIKVRIADLIPHEETIKEGTRKHVKSMLRTGVQKRPIVVHYLKDENKYLVLDGHHRIAALSELGCQYVMASKVDYFSKDIRVKNWEKRKAAPKKEEIIKAALSSKLLGPKSSKHQSRLMNGKWVRFHDDPCISPVINYPIGFLRK